MMEPAAQLVATETEGGVPVRVAGLWRRSIATVVDAVILSPLLIALGWLAFRLTGFHLPVRPQLRLESVLELFLEGGTPLWGLIATGLVIVLLYGFVFMSTSGATPGLRLMRLRVINLYGDPPEWWRVLLRCLGFVISVLLLGLGFLWIGFDREKRGLHDWLAGTYVIRCREATAPAAAMEGRTP
jgi:uncharacterized RDD family membrane protein YckC